jgi:hypothetical protein
MFSYPAGVVSAAGGIGCIAAPSKDLVDAPLLFFLPARHRRQ